MFDKLARMQHFGLPTRLLDVSLNALADQKVGFIG
jgi:hypothetical protein